MNARAFFAALPIPIIQSPMIGASTPEMAAAVCRAGGLGSLAPGSLQPEAIEPLIHDFRAGVAGPFAVNLLVTSPTRPAGDVVRAAIDRLAPWYARAGRRSRPIHPTTSPQPLTPSSPP